MDTLPAPKTLQEWRDLEPRPEGYRRGVCPRNVWTPLESFFLSQGYTLWQPPLSLHLKPPNDAPRTPDGFAYRTIYCIEPYEHHFNMIVSQTSESIFASQISGLTPTDSKNNIHCPARTTDNRDVLIRLMAIGEDRGERHRTALSRVATGNNALRGNNHVVPVLQEIVHDDMIFAVFPLMADGFDDPWFYHFSEVLDAVEQVLEVTVFFNLLSFLLSLFNRVYISVMSIW
jgi:hypothetical protein